MWLNSSSRFEPRQYVYPLGFLFSFFRRPDQPLHRNITPLRAVAAAALPQRLAEVTWARSATESGIQTPTSKQLLPIH